MRYTLGLCLLLPAIAFGQTTVERVGPANRVDLPKGKELDAIDGDFLIKNGIANAVIAQARRDRNANMTVKNISGALIDFTENKGNSDQLSAFYPGRRSFTWATEEIVVVEEEGQQLPTIVFATKNSDVVLRYAMPVSRIGIRVQTTFKNSEDKPKQIKFEDDIRADGGKEYMGKNPNGDDEIAWIEDRFWGQAYGVISEHGKIRSNNNARVSVLKYMVDGKPDMLLKPGEEFTLTRWVFAARDLLEVRAMVAVHRGQADSLVLMNLKLEDGLGRSIPDAVIQFRKDDQLLGHSKNPERIAIARGDYTIHAVVNGEKLEPKQLAVKESPGAQIIGKATLQFPKYKPGTISADISAEDGSPIPCKVELRAQKGTPTPDFGPETAEFGVKNVIYTPNGKFERAVPSGKYDIIISRGPEYDAIFTELTVPEGKTARLVGKLVRSVQTPGWVSCDYHSHSSPSGDNTGSQLGRVLNLAAEHIEFAPCTEHNRVSTYDGHIESQELGEFLATVSGMELTGNPLPLNHQNVFPMVHRPYQQDGGGPVVDSSQKNRSNESPRGMTEAER